jgi:hypothetical protein
MFIIKLRLGQGDVFLSEQPDCQAAQVFIERWCSINGGEVISVQGTTIILRPEF